MLVKEHYDNHLAEIYAWMTGGFDNRVADFMKFLKANGVQPNSTKRALDLGAGHGIQSVALANLGYDVTAIDFNEHLLNELRLNKNGRSISTVQADICQVKEFISLKPELIVCCGDTIPHLDSLEQLDALLQDCYDTLEQDGKLILTFRDYSDALTDTQRFIPVKSDEHRILTCILDFSDDKITVTDLLHEKIDGAWKQKVSSYKKLRIRTDQVMDSVRGAGFSIVEDENIKGMMHMVVAK